MKAEGALFSRRSSNAPFGRKWDWGNMSENLQGIFEAISYKENTNLQLSDDADCNNYAPHWHTALEIIMPTENIYTAVCAEHSFVLEENDIILFRPCCLHALYAPKVGRRIVLQIDVAILQGIREWETLLSILPPVVVIRHNENPCEHTQIRALLLEIRQEYFSGGILSSVSIYAKFLSICVLIGRGLTGKGFVFDSPQKQQAYMEMFLYVCDYINTHCTEELSLDDVAALTAFSKFHFTRLFKQFTGMSFARYWNQKRIAMAEQLLSNPSCSITDAAYRSGFSTLSSFIRMFKIIKGCTPSAFRKMHGPI